MNLIRCDFCGGTTVGTQEWRKGVIIASPDHGQGSVHICDECVGMCQELIAEHRTRATDGERKMPPPSRDD